MIVTLIGALGGFELIKLIFRWLTSRKTDKRIAEAEADKSEFNLLKETIQFLQQQLMEKEERFAEQTQLVRRQNQQIIDLTNALAEEKMAHKMDECQDKNCPFREPPKAYTPPRADTDRTNYFENRQNEEQNGND